VSTSLPIVRVLPWLVAAGLILPQLTFTSLWLDEAWVADTVPGGSFSPPDLNSTPLGFAALVRATTEVAGPTEFGLRQSAAGFYLGAVLAIISRHGRSGSLAGLPCWLTA
jgi:hypothetical protein